MVGTVFVVLLLLHFVSLFAYILLLLLLLILVSIFFFLLFVSLQIQRSLRNVAKKKAYCVHCVLCVLYIEFIVAVVTIIWIYKSWEFEKCSICFPRYFEVVIGSSLFDCIYTISNSKQTHRYKQDIHTQNCSTVLKT